MESLTHPASPTTQHASAGKVVAIIPTFNEAEAISAVIGALPRDLICRVIVVDGGSFDRTTALAREAGAEVISVSRGYGRACLAGAKAAEADDILVFLDGDGADDAGAIAALVAPIRADRADFVIASRAQGRLEPGSMAWHQLLAGRLAGILTRCLYGVRYTDMCALRAIRCRTLLGLGMRELTYGWNLEMQMRAARAGLRVIELPVDYRRRLGGRSKVAGSLPGSVKAGLRIAATFARVAIERPRGRR